MRAVVIGIVRFYQRVAPVRIRRNCRFEPSCSTYMILAVQKYGVLTGIRQGIGRLIRCRAPHGGVDYP